MTSPGGGIGRRAGLKHQFLWSTGSIPVLGTKPIIIMIIGFFIERTTFFFDWEEIGVR